MLMIAIELYILSNKSGQLIMSTLHKHCSTDTQTINALKLSVYSLDFTLNSRMIELSLTNFKTLYLLKLDKELIGYALVVEHDSNNWLEF